MHFLGNCVWLREQVPEQRCRGVWKQLSTLRLGWSQDQEAKSEQCAWKGRKWGGPRPAVQSGLDMDHVDEIPDLSFFDQACDFRRAWTWAAHPSIATDPVLSALFCLADPAGVSPNSMVPQEVMGAVSMVKGKKYECSSQSPNFSS